MEKFSELKKLEKKELLEKVSVLRKESLNLRFQKITSQVTHPSKICETKKIIARLKTTLKEKINA